MAKKHYSSKSIKRGRTKATNKAYGATGSEADNDVSWYTRYPSLVKAPSNIIFNHRYGFPYYVIPNVTWNSSTVSGAYQNYNNIPGVVGMEFRFTLAGDGTELDPVNICSKNLYTYIRHANSGSANYESSDMMQYVVTVLGLQTRLEQLKRDLRLSLTFNAYNRYVAKSILLNRGYTSANIDDMVVNNAVYVGTINGLIAQMNTFKIPKDFPIFDKYTWMVTNIFKDDNLNKASYYYYFTNDLVHYDWANAKVTFTRTAPGTFLTEIQRIQSEINNLQAYEDINIMWGDILKAYKQEGCRVWSPMQMGEIQDASYSAEVLSQMINTTSYFLNDVLTIEQIASNTQLLGLKQGTSASYGVIKSVVSSGDLSGTTFLSTDTAFEPELVMFEDEPSNDSVIVSTRNTIACTLKNEGTDNDVTATITDYPSCIINDIRISFYKTDGTLAVIDTNSLYFYNSNDADTQNLIVAKGFNLTCFPVLYRWYLDSGDLYENVYTYGKNNLTVSSEWLRNLHAGCKTSEFSLPMFKLLESN